MPMKRTSLAARRKAVGFSQDQLAERLKVDRSTVARWESGETEPQPWMRPRLARALQVSVDQLDELLTTAVAAEAEADMKQSDGTRKAAPFQLVPVGAGVLHNPDTADDTVAVYASSPSSSSITLNEMNDASKDFWEIGYDSHEELMRRRAFLANVAALAGLSAADTPTAIEAIRQELNLSFVEERAAADVDEWQKIALDYGESYPVLAPTELLRPLMVDMLGLQVALQRHRAWLAQRDLLRVAALLSAFTAQTITNMGQPHEAIRWWRTAKAAADRSGDSYSALWVRSRGIVRAMESRPVPAILRLIEEAEVLSGAAPPAAALEFLGGKAQTLALAGRERGAVHALEQLQEKFGEVPSGYSGSVLSWGQERLHNTESFAYSRLGDLAKTEAARVAGLALYDATNVRWPAVLELNLAFCLVQSGDVAEGLRHAQTLIESLPEGQFSSPMANDTRKLLRAVPLKYQRTAEVQQYREWVTYAVPRQS